MSNASRKTPVGRKLPSWCGWAWLAPSVLLAGCRGDRSVLAPVSAEAGRIAQLWWVFFCVCALVYVIVMMVALAAWVKHRRAPAESPPEPVIATASAEKRLLRRVAWATAMTTLIVLALLVADLVSQRQNGPREDGALVVQVTGHQWWWSIEYQSPHAAEVFETANEIHVPVGRPIKLLLESNDVIHSFWVPRLHGKRDLIPGHPTSLTFQVDRPGRYAGQCAEFCGYQHAHMGIVVVAEEPAQFEAWAQGQRRIPPDPVTAAQIRGREIFVNGTCALCHSVQGTMARSRVGPTLTHFASRQTLGTGVRENTRENRGAWILDPHNFKPGVRMPPQELSSPDLQAVLDYLETLK